MFNQLVSLAAFTLGTLQKYAHFLSSWQLETVVHAFVSTCLDYCNALYFCLSQDFVSRLQVSKTLQQHYSLRPHIALTSPQF